MLQHTSNTIKYNYVFNLIVLFSLIYDISLVKFPSLTSGRIALFVMFLMYYRDLKSIILSRKLASFLIIMIFLFIAALIQFFISKDLVQLSRIIWFVLYTIVAPLLIIRRFYNLRSFLTCFCIATCIQSIIAVNAFISPEFKQWILSFIIVGGNDIEDGIYRAISMTSSSGAALSIIQFCGLYSGLHLIRFFKLSFSMQLFIVFSILLNLISTLVIGRTGLVLSLFSIFAFILSTLNLRVYLLMSVSLLVATQINYIGILESQTESIEGFKVEFFLNWLEDGFNTNENTTASTLKSMPIPPLKLNTILGTGQIFNAKTGKNASGNDSGYIQTYYSMGIVLCITFYVSYLLFLLGHIPSTNRGFHLLLLLYLFFIEIKEPFIFKYVFPFFIFSFFLLERKNNLLSTNNIVKIN